MMIGIDLRIYDAVFAKVPAHLNYSPARSFNGLQAIGERARHYMRAYHGDDADFAKIVHNMPMNALRALSIDQLAKLRHASQLMMDRSVEDHFDVEPRLRLIHKISNSAWRWGCNRIGWNETVDAYEGIRNFDLGVEGLSVTLDMTTGHNERGSAEHSRTYLDGVFAFLVHHEGRHVMTIGFSIAAGRRLLLQQVQLQERRGNRWLFRLPTSNRLELVVDRLRTAFPRHRIHIAEGAAIAQVNIDSYRRGVEILKQRLDTARRRLASDTAGQSEIDDVIDYEEQLAALLAKVEHLEADRPRLAAFYADAGRFALGRAVNINRIDHLAVAA